MAACTAVLTAACNAAESPSPQVTSSYRLNYSVTPQPQQNRMLVTLTLVQKRSLLREMRMSVPAAYFSQIKGDGKLSVQDEQLIWLPPPQGGTLSWSVALNRLKTNDRYDAYMTPEWALFRASDIIPPAQTRTLKAAASKTSLSFVLPAGWSSVTQYYGRKHKFKVNNPERRFDRPTGWVLLGNIGVRTEQIAGIKVKIAAPIGHRAHRLDMLALLTWTLPEVTRLFADFPSRLTIISADQPMWRGGLSAPSSLFVNASLPLISENGTSALLHEVVHIGLGTGADTGADWIIEGLAEYYSLQALLRSGTISQQRFDSTLAKLASWGEAVTSLCGNNASGPVTAKATVLMHEINVELEQQTGGKHILDDVIHILTANDRKITLDELKGSVALFLQQESNVISRSTLLNCDS